MKTKSKLITGGLENTLIGTTTVKKGEDLVIDDKVLENIRKGFQLFIEDKTYIDICSNYELFHNSFIYQIFTIDPFEEEGEDKVELINPFSADGTFRSSKKFLFSIAKILNMSDGFKEELGLEVGDIVTLRDYDTATLVNPRYEIFTSSLEMNKSNAVNVSKEPSKYMNNIERKVHNVFYPRKLDVNTQFKDEYIFTGTTADVITKVKNPEEWI